MKYKSYENSAEEFATGLNAELLSAKDNVSARSVNRPIINILENQESSYNLIQTLLKTVYGNTNGIVPDVLENFAPETFEIGSFKNDSQNYFIRIPTGMMLLSKLVKEDYSNNNSNPFLKKGDYNYKDNIHKDCFLNDKLHSFLIENKPEINLYERELANLINLDLTDLTNDLRIYQDLVPMTVKVEIVDETGNPRLSSNGSPMYVTDENSKVIYLAKEGLGDLDIYYGDTRATINSLNYITTYNETTNSETPNLNNETIKQTVTYRENLQTKIVPNGTYTNDINKALILKDASGNEKVRTGYYMNVVRATSGDDEVTWLPNKQQYAHWDIFLPSSDFGAGSNTDVTVKFFDENGEVVETIPFYFSDSLTLQETNDKFFGEVLFFSKKFNIEKIQANDSTGNPIIGSRISVKNDNSYYDNYKMTISYRVTDDTGSREFFYQDVITEQFIDELAINRAEEQQYFTNIFDLTNAFLGYFSSYFVNITNIYNYLNLETIIKIGNVAQTYYLYYDLDGKLENQTDDKYDKTGRFYLTTNGDPKVNASNFIKLFEIKVEPNNILPNNPVVRSVKSFFDPLDRRLIATKRAELNSLLSTTRTELNNYTHVKDADGNREIEIKEKFNNANDEQLRITSPITRILDVKDKEEHLEPAINNWTDSGDGDTPSDFFEESYEVLDTKKSESDAGFRKYIYNNNVGKKGIIINKNKGISIFNYDESQVDGDTHSYSSFKPIEICSAKGNINLFNTNNPTGRINIANLKDDSTNIVDIKGKTRIRSRNDDQLVIKKIGEVDKPGNANVVFQIGQSKSKNDIDSITSTTDTQNAVIGELSFTTGETGTSGNNVVSHNRKFKLGLQKVAGHLKDHIKTIFEARNTKDNSDDEKSVITSYSSIVPGNSKIMLGYPINSRTYKKEKENYIPYVEGEDVDSNILASIKKDEYGNYTGTSTEYIGNENRWAAAFINRGYFGRIVLSDTESDKKNKDARNGALRLGNSNIFDVSSIFINTTRRTINFDNTISNTSENTIYSNYPKDDYSDYPEDKKEEAKEALSKNGLFFFLNRTLDKTIDTDINIEPDNGTNYCALGLRTNGTHINKNAYIYRQAFINVNSGENESTTENNSSFVVKGQTVLNGELVIGKKAATIDDTADHTSSTSIVRNSYDNYKKYNLEFFEKDTDDITLREKDEEKDKYEDEDKKIKLYKYRNERKDEWLYMLVNYGRSYFEGDITVDENHKFTENTVLNKKLTILNHNYANYDYNVINSATCPEEDDRLVNKTGFDFYYVDDYVEDIDGIKHAIKFPRNQVSLDVESGLIRFGSKTKYLGIGDEVSKDEEYSMDDQSDLELYGSQWIKRRLEINPDGSSLRNTYMYYKDGDKNNITDRNSKESPSFYVNGASQFSGNVVFGNSLADCKYTDTTINKTYDCKALGNNKQPGKDEAENPMQSTNPAKIIFWGADANATLDEAPTEDNPDKKVPNWHSDFDFHGKTWFDYRVRIGRDEDDHLASDSYETSGTQRGSLEILGKSLGGTGYEEEAALMVSGKILFKDGHESNWQAKRIHLEANSNPDLEGSNVSELVLNNDVDAGYVNAKLYSSGDVNIESGVNTNITSTTGSITLKTDTKTEDKNKIILYNAENGTISLGNDKKTTTIDLLTSDGTINAKYNPGGSFNVAFIKNSTTTVNKIVADESSLTLKTNDKTSIELLDSNDAINSKANNFTHSVGNDEKISINSSNSIFKHGGNNCLNLSANSAVLSGGLNATSTLTLDSAAATLNRGETTLTLNNSIATLSSGIVKINDVVQFGNFTIGNGTYGTQFDNHNIYTVGGLNLVGDGTLIISQSTGASLSLSSNNFTLAKGNTTVKGDSSDLILCGSSNIKFTLGDTTNEFVTFSSTGLATFNINATFGDSNKLIVASGNLEIGGYAITIS